MEEDYEELNNLENVFVEVQDDGEEKLIEKEPFEFQKRFPQEVKEWQGKFKSYKANIIVLERLTGRR